MKSTRSRAQPAPQEGIAPSQVLELIDSTLERLASEEGAVPRREVIDAFLDLRFAVATIDAVERFLAGGEPFPSTPDASTVQA